MEAEVRIPFDRGLLEGRLAVPPGALGLVLFAHGSGSSRHSRRNVAVAEVLHRSSIGTLLFDLLTEHESADRTNVFDAALLGGRLGAATRAARAHRSVGDLPIGYFGASTGAAAALWAAAADREIRAVVSRGGRPDLAGERLRLVRCPVLLVVGGSDPEVLRLNEQAAAVLDAPHELAVIPAATHLFEEPGALEEVARLAADWFVEHLPRE